MEKAIRIIYKNNLEVRVYSSRNSLGYSAAIDIKNKIKELLIKKDEVNIIFAAAPSQNEMLDELVSCNDIDFSKINAFHMDEYIGLDINAPQGFGNFLKNKLFSKVNFKSVNYINSSCKNYEEECKRYEELLKKHKIDIVCMGIGENGHIAFNDPHVARFDDDKLVKIVDLDEKCRLQQVNDKCFDDLDLVPKYAITLTISALTNSSHIFCVVPAKTKANAVKETVFGEISTNCPASILRNHKNAVLYTDMDSGISLL